MSRLPRTSDQLEPGAIAFEVSGKVARKVRRLTKTRRYWLILAVRDEPRFDAVTDELVAAAGAGYTVEIPCLRRPRRGPERHDTVFLWLVEKASLGAAQLQALIARHLPNDIVLLHSSCDVLTLSEDHAHALANLLQAVVDSGAPRA